jgi:hypothetical protein
MSFSYFFGAAAGGFVLLAAIGIQALVALFSSVPLTRRHKEEHPEFNARKAYHRIALVTVITLAVIVTVTVLVLRYAPTSASFGYLFGMIIAFLCSIKRMSPNNEQNQKNYEESYVDCYPADENPDDAGTAAPDPTDVSPAGSGNEAEKHSKSE